MAAPPAMSYNMESNAYNRMGINSKKAIVDKTMRTTPFVRVRAKDINSDAAAIKPKATKEAHILSNEDILNSPTLSSHSTRLDFITVYHNRFPLTQAGARS
jgi:Holliday junction resolvase-like predicted endonuclease